MPPVQTYAVDFSNGNLAPSIDVNGWGSMKQGLPVPAHPGNQALSYADLAKLFRFTLAVRGRSRL